MEKQNLTLEDIKVGETYNVRVTVALIGDSVIHCSIGGTTINFWKTAVSAFSPISPEPAPKYDPNRLFRKGDKVRVVEWKGRNYYDIDHETKLETGCLAEIWDDEKDEQLEGYVSVIYQEYIFSVPLCFLELVTPVDELEPYYIVDDDLDAYFSFFAIQNRNSLMSHDLEEEVARYVYGTEYTADKETVRKRAEAECARLNAEHRKEQK